MTKNLAIKEIAALVRAAADALEAQSQEAYAEAKKCKSAGADWHTSASRVLVLNGSAIHLRLVAVGLETLT